MSMVIKTRLQQIVASLVPWRIWIQSLFLLAVVANVFYCAAYIVDVAAQSSEFRKTWQRHRWILFAVGTTFASIIARFISMDMFGQVVQSAG